MAKRANQWRGCSDLVYALVTKDDATGYETGEVKELAFIKQIGASQEQTTATVFADNTAIFNSNSAIKFTRTFDCLAIDGAVKAELEGQYTEEGSSLVLSSSAAQPKLVAIGYKIYDTDDTCYYVWCLKGTCSFGEETIITRDDGTDSNGVQMTFSALETVHKFAKNGSETQVMVAENDAVYDTSAFFDEVTTPDTLLKKSV